MPDRIYLDNAATSWPKPEAVYQSVDHYQRELGAPAGRGAYREAIEVERRVQSARTSLAKLLNVPTPSRVIFTSGGTESLNLAIHGLLKAGDHVITSMADHNSVLRPLRFLEEMGQIAVSRVPVDSDGRVDATAVRAEFRSSTRLVVLTHASNVTGALQPVEEVGKMTGENGILFLLDAAQTVGHLPVDMQAIGCDLLAAPGHKGLLGLLGTGILCLQTGVEEVLTPIKQGGTGSRSSKDRQPDSLPDAYESGNLNVPGIFGLAAGVEYILDRGVQTIHQEEATLTRAFIQAVQQMSGTTLFGPIDDRRVGVVSLHVEDTVPQEVASMLDSSRSIQVRAGFHCAALIHQALQTTAAGTVRFSVGAFNSLNEIEQTVETLEQLAAAIQ